MSVLSASAGRRSSPARVGVNCAVAAHHHRHRGGAQSAWRRGDGERVADARDHGRRRRLGAVAADRLLTGWFCLDDLVLAADGMTRFRTLFAVTPGGRLQPDFFVPLSRAGAGSEADGMVGWRAPVL